MRSTMVDVDVHEQLDPEAEVKTKTVEVQKTPEKTASKAPTKKKQVVANESVSETDGLLMLPLDALKANEDQPRLHFEESEIEALASSIRESGILQPILVRRGEAEGQFQIVAGERRFRAAQAAGLSKIPAVFRDLSDRETLELGIVENVQRSDLNPIEVASAYERLIKEFGLSQEEVAKTVGKERVSISNSVRLLKLPEDVQSLIAAKEISAGHGRALLMLDSAGKQRVLAKRIAKDKLSVRAAEQIASGKSLEKKTKPKKTEKKSPAVLDLEQRIRRGLGTKVSLSMDKEGAGEIKINFFSSDELESLLERLDV